jgi:hypothetical protein
MHGEKYDQLIYKSMPTLANLLAHFWKLLRESLLRTHPQQSEKPKRRLEPPF